ncbi:hypothetical protein OY671_009360, partial [Metschnikowia pulcherrima]
AAGTAGAAGSRLPDRRGRGDAVDGSPRRFVADRVRRRTRGAGRRDGRADTGSLHDHPGRTDRRAARHRAGIRRGPCPAGMWERAGIGARSSGGHSRRAAHRFPRRHRSGRLRDNRRCRRPASWRPGTRPRRDGRYAVTDGGYAGPAPWRCRGPRGRRAHPGGASHGRRHAGRIPDAARSIGAGGRRASRLSLGRSRRVRARAIARGGRAPRRSV